MGLGKKEKPEGKNLLKSVVVKNYSVPVWGLGALILVIVVLIATFVVMPAARNGKKQAEVLTVSTLEKIIDVSELSTFTAVYNGIAQVADEENPESVD